MHTQKYYHMHNKPIICTVYIVFFFPIAKPNSLFEDTKYLLSTLKVFMSAV